MNEAELHVLRARMYQGMLNKARRGEAFNHPPIGYVKSPTQEGFDKDPDEQVQSVVRLIFFQFERIGTVYGLLRYLVREGISIPVRPHQGLQRGVLQWRRPNRVTLQTLLRHPIYAGFYRWGHRAVDPKKKVPGRRQSGRTCRRPEECLVLLPGRCPAYVTAEQFGANQERLDANRATAASQGAPGRGPSLLGGLLVCGRSGCGCRMMVNYTDSGRGGLRYYCGRDSVCYGGPECQSLSGRLLDELVAAQVLAALQPAALELHLAAAADVEHQRQLLHQNWQQQLQRAAFCVDRACRQYQACEPENRLVARELERRWEEAMRERDRLQQEYDRFCATQPSKLSATERQQIRQLAQDIPLLWSAETTTAQDRQRLVRLVVEKVEVEVQGDSEQVKVAIHWQGGTISRHELARSVQRYEQLSNYDRLCTRMDELRAAGKSMEEVAVSLNGEGFHPAKRAERFTAGMVSGLLARRCAEGTRNVRRKKKGEWWLLGELARYLGMPQVTLHSWRKAGWVEARKEDTAGGQWLLRASGQERRRMARLRRYQKKNPNKPIPEELTTPIVPDTK